MLYIKKKDKNWIAQLGSETFELGSTQLRKFQLRLIITNLLFPWNGCFCLSPNNSTACTYWETLKPFVTHTYKELFGMHIDLMFLELACMYWCEATISSMQKDSFWQNVIRSHCLGMSYNVNFFGSNEFHIKWRFGTHGSWKNQNPGGCFGATS